MIRITDLGDPFTAPDTGMPSRWPRPGTFQKLPPSELFDPGEPGEAGPVPPAPETFRGGVGPGDVVGCPFGFTRNPVPPHNCLEDVETASADSPGGIREAGELTTRDPYTSPAVTPQEAWDYERTPGPLPEAWERQMTPTPTPGGGGMPPTPTGGLTPTPTPGGGGGGLMPTPTPGGFSVPGGLAPSGGGMTPTPTPGGGGMPTIPNGGGGMPGGGAPPAPPALIDTPTLGVPIRIATPMTMAGFLGQVPVRCVGF